MNPKKIFAGKKITLMGLGTLGRGIGDAQFLARAGADLTVTDVKTAAQLKTSLVKLKRYKNIKYVLGEHRLADFSGKDMILKGAGMPLHSPFLTEARKHRIPIETDESLFAQYTEGTIIGVTGTRGKTTTTNLIYEILKKAGKTVYLAGNIKGMATLPLVTKVKKGDYVVMELASWQLQGLQEIRLSPHIAVFTNFTPDHLNYYQGDMDLYYTDKTYIFSNQKKGDYLVADEVIARKIKHTHGKKLQGRLVITSAKQTPKTWKTKLLGEHNRANIALAVAVAKILKIKPAVVKKAIEKFPGVPGRLELVRELKGVKYYNDTTATTPHGVMAGLKALGAGKKRNIVLIGGGTDKVLEYDELVKTMAPYIKAAVLFKGSATEKIKQLISKSKRVPYQVAEAVSMKEAFELACGFAKRGDIVLLSPGAASFGIFLNEFDRGDQFVKLVKKLK